MTTDEFLDAAAAKVFGKKFDQLSGQELNALETRIRMAGLRLDRDRREKLWGNSASICSCCGKHFYVSDVKQWGYRIGGTLYCSWTCLRKADHKEKRRYASRKKKEDS